MESSAEMGWKTSASNGDGDSVCENCKVGVDLTELTRDVWSLVTDRTKDPKEVTETFARLLSASILFGSRRGSEERIANWALNRVLHFVFDTGDMGLKVGEK